MLRHGQRLVVLELFARRIRIRSHHDLDILAAELALARQVVDPVAALPQQILPVLLGRDRLIAVAVKRTLGQVGVDPHGRHRVALAHAAAVALLHRGGLPRQVEVMDIGRALLQVDALAHRRRVADDDLQLAGVERVGDVLALHGRAGDLRIDDGDLVARDALGNECIDDLVVRVDVVGEDHLAAILHALGDVLGQALVFRARLALVGDGVEDLQIQRGLVHLVHDREDVAVAGGVLALGLVLQHLAVGRINLLLRRAHLDEVHVRVGLRQHQADVIGRRAVDVALHDLAQLVHVLEAGGHQRVLDLAAGVEDRVVLEDAEAVEELFTVADTDVLEGLRRDVAEHRIDLERAVLRRGRGQAIDALVAVVLQQPAGFQVEVQRPVREPLPAQEFRRLAETVLGRVKVFLMVHFIGNQHVDADLVEIDRVGAVGEFALGDRLLVVLADLLDALVAGIAQAVTALHPEILAVIVVLRDRIEVELLEGRFGDDHEIVVVLGQVVVLALALVGVVVAADELAVLHVEGGADGQHLGAREPLLRLGIPVRQDRLRHDDGRLLRPALDLRHARQQQAT